MKEIENIKHLLGREVTRKEFLTHLGLVLVAAMGLQALLKNITSVFNSKSSSSSQSSQGYGWSAYSGLPPRYQGGPDKIVRGIS